MGAYGLCGTADVVVGYLNEDSSVKTEQYHPGNLNFHVARKPRPLPRIPTRCSEMEKVWHLLSDLW